MVQVHHILSISHRIKCYRKKFKINNWTKWKEKNKIHLQKDLNAPTKTYIIFCWCYFSIDERMILYVAIIACAFHSSEFSSFYFFSRFYFAILTRLRVQHLLVWIRCLSLFLWLLFNEWSAYGCDYKKCSLFLFI